MSVLTIPVAHLRPAPVPRRPPSAHRPAAARLARGHDRQWWLARALIAAGLALIPWLVVLATA